MKTVTTTAFRRALAEAEAKLEPRPESADKFVSLRIDQITTRTELFQPRRFYMTNVMLKDEPLDTKHVKALEKQIGYKNGDLEPILVIGIDGQWVCVDGHHRLAAYGRRYGRSKRTKPIECEWFAGTVRQAADESVRRNGIIKLAIPNQDRYEQAWRRVVMSDPETRTGWSKSQIVELCGVSDGL